MPTNSETVVDQVQFAVKFITGEKKLPTESEMMADMREQNQIHWNKGFSRRKTHNLYPEREYYKQLTDTAEIENFPDVILSLTDENARLLREEPTEFRKYKYTVIDDKTFKRETCEDGNQSFDYFAGEGYTVVVNKYDLL